MCCVIDGHLDKVLEGNKAETVNKVYGLTESFKISIQVLLSTVCTSKMVHIQVFELANKE